ncbi:MAG: hypothetical protein A3H96_16310 [Acidobacteria bacterium RIFCSPLOWO2_02_FULL_67_36]|nr:MAG: hypothetical protein A3H96_16310 [Acidobacteria bacterium RIFCSPLOWO2_02_FULL_67_36]
MAAVAITLWGSATAFAQLDPLLFLKRVPPTVIIIVDTSLSMLTEGNCSFSAGTCTLLDPGFWPISDPVIGAFSPVPTTVTYRRKIVGFNYTTTHGNGNKQYTATRLDAVQAAFDPSISTSIPASDLAFLDSTRLSIAKAGIVEAVTTNAAITRWGLVRLRQASATWGLTTSPRGVQYVGGPDCAYYVNPSDATQNGYNDTSPCHATAGGQFGIYIPSVGTNANYSQSSSGVLVAAGNNTSSQVLTVVNRQLGDVTGLAPTGVGGPTYEDRPLAFALDDARAAVIEAMHADTAANRTCRNTVVVLITGGRDSGGLGYTANSATKASTFLTVASDGVTKRVPIHVLAVKPNLADDTETTLQTIATNSGGVYRRIDTTNDLAAGIDYAVQAGYSRSSNFEASTTSDFLPVSPIVGTVNLKNAPDYLGNPLLYTDITANPGGQALSQRSNMLVTSGFSLPGFDGVMRAFRVYKPEPDTTKPTGWKFTSDGTRLWPDLDGRPLLAGKARVPADPNTRNIYTYVPDGSGGGSVVAFTTANEAQFRTAMGTADASTTTDLITLVRAQQLGAIIGSTPALMDPPSLDPPPDDAYGRTDAAASFAGVHKDRRSMIFVGANDGMIHAIDARSGYEVWAFIPYNLLPKLRTLRDGQAIEQFDYFVDSSPKIAEVKIGGAWKSLMIIGEGPGGVFYQAFDVTEAGMGVDPSLGDLATVSTLLGRFDSPNESIQFKWAFPNYSSFDPTYASILTVTDGTPGGKLRLFGDLKAAASYAEKTVGFAWSDPAVGTLTADRSTTAVIVGSGYFPDVEALLPGRGASAPKAGNALYLLDVDTGALIGNAGGASCPAISDGSGSGAGCVSIGDVSGDGRKNALQADPTAAGDNASIVVNKAYIGDVDGKYWRFTFDSTGTISARLMRDTAQPIYASSALLFIGSTDVYMFFATGSDLLASGAPGGTGTFKLYGLKDNYPANGSTLKFARDLTTVTDSSGVATGERPSTAPSVAGDIVFYSTTVESSSTPCSDFSAKLYALTYAGGAAYDANNNGRIDTNETPVVATVAGRATAPFIVDQHLYLGTAGGTGANVEAFGDPSDFNNGIGQVGVRILSWREIR